MKYTIDDLRGKYVKVGTPECDEFLKACVKLEVTWVGGVSAKFVTYNAEFIGISKLFDDDNPTLGHSHEEYWVRNGFVPFVPCTVDNVDDTVTQRGERYGLFADGAVIMQDLKAVMRATPGWERLTPSQREALEMICIITTVE
jgi:hypothetical protein